MYRAAMMAGHSGGSVLTAAIRAPKEFVTDEAVRAQIQRATEFASQFGSRIAMDLNVRLAREVSREVDSGELQEMLRLREVALQGGVKSRSASQVMLLEITTPVMPHRTFPSGAGWSGCLPIHAPGKGSTLKACRTLPHDAARH